MPGASIGAISIGDIFGKAMGGRTKPRRTTVKEAHAPLFAEESEKLLDPEQVTRLAIHEVENNGIVFLDEIDKICARDGRGGDGGISREGVQRDLLPLIEGTTVPTKHGPVKTDHILSSRPARSMSSKAVRPSAGASGSLADPGRTGASDRRGFPTDPDRNRGLDHQSSMLR